MSANSFAVLADFLVVLPDLVAVRPALLVARPNLVAVCPDLVAVRPDLVAVRPNLVAVRPALLAARPNLHRMLASLAAESAGVPRALLVSLTVGATPAAARRTPLPNAGKAMEVLRESSMATSNARALGLRRSAQSTRSCPRKRPRFAAESRPARALHAVRRMTLRALLLVASFPLALLAAGCPSESAEPSHGVCAIEGARYYEPLRCSSTTALPLAGCYARCSQEGVPCPGGKTCRSVPHNYCPCNDVPDGGICGFDGDCCVEVTLCTP